MRRKSSFLTVFPADADRGRTSNVNWQASSQPVANQIIVGTLLNRSHQHLQQRRHGRRHHRRLRLLRTRQRRQAKALQGRARRGDRAHRVETGDTGDTGDKVERPTVSRAEKGDTGDCRAGRSRVHDRPDDQLERHRRCRGRARTPLSTPTRLRRSQCTTNQSIGWNGAAWVCKSQPIVATLSRVATGQNPVLLLGHRTCSRHTARTSIRTALCNDYYCTIRLVDVIDHNSCRADRHGQLESKTRSYIWTST